MILNKHKRGISPVIAVVLLIALTVASAAVIYTIISNIDEDFGTFAITGVEGTYDYNNDGKVDAINLKVTNVGEGGTLQWAGIVSGGISEWDIGPDQQLSFEGGTHRTIKIMTSVTQNQVEKGTTIAIGLGENSAKSSVNPEVEIPTTVIETSPVTVSVTAGGDPVIGTYVSFTTGDGLPGDFPPTLTDNNGEVNAYLLPNYYIAKTSSGQESELFHNTLKTNIKLADATEKVKVQLIDSNNLPLVGVNINVADGLGNDIGQGDITNSTGWVSFSLTKGTYLFYASYLGQDYWSSSIVIPITQGSSIRTIKIGTGELIGKALFGTTPVGGSKLVRLYTYTNSSLGKYDYTNTSSYFEFTTGIVSGRYRLRLDYQNNRYWSGIVSTSDPNLEVNFGGGDMNILVTAGGSPLPSGVLIRLRNADNTSTGSYDYLNSSGYAEFGARPGGDYRIRVDWLGQKIITSAFSHDGTVITRELGGGPLNVQVLAGGTPLPSGVLIRLFNVNNKTTGRYDYLNSTGFAEYGAIPAGVYRVRIDWLGQKIMSAPIPHDGGVATVDINGGTLNLLVTAGGTPLPSGVLIRLFNVNNKTTGKYDYLNSTGFAEYGAIPSGIYRVRVDWLGQKIMSKAFDHNGSAITPINVGGGGLNVLVTAGVSPLPSGVLVRLFNANNKTTGRYDYLNGSGIAEYGAIPEGNYRVRIDWLGRKIMSTPIIHINSTTKTVQIDGGVLNVQITSNGDQIPSGVLIRLYNAAGSSTGRYDYVNGTGMAEFGVIPEGNYTVRMDWLSRKLMSSSFVHNGSTQPVDYGGGTINISILVGGATLPNGVLIRFYISTGTSTGIYDYVYNGDGSVFFQAIPEGNYKFRMDWMGKKIFSGQFNWNGTDPLINYNGAAKIVILAKDGAGSDIGASKLIKLYWADGTYTGRYAYTNSSSFVEFLVVPEGNYMLRFSSDYSDSFDVYAALPDLNLTLNIPGPGPFNLFRATIPKKEN